VKLCLRHWGIVILSSRVGLGEKPLRESCGPVVRHRVARAGQGDDDRRPALRHGELTRGSSFRPQPHPRRIAVCELDARPFQGSADCFQGLGGASIRAGLNVADGVARDASALREVPNGPV
jgi:hypothetical protein